MCISSLIQKLSWKETEDYSTSSTEIKRLQSYPKNLVQGKEEPHAFPGRWRLKEAWRAVPEDRPGAWSQLHYCLLEYHPQGVDVKLFFQQC